MGTSGTLISLVYDREQNGKMIFLLIFVLIFCGVHQQIRHILMQIPTAASIEGQIHIVMWNKTFQCKWIPLQDIIGHVERVKANERYYIKLAS